MMFSSITYSARFDELDKPPEGAHAGQMLLGAFINFGFPRGNLIDAENDFLDEVIDPVNNTILRSTYTFENGVTKEIEVSHLSFAFGLTFEYMFYNHFGINTRLRRSYIVQKSNFGSNYKNWTGYLYRDISLYFGPSIHATNRKRWDFVFTPLLGYVFSKYIATPIAKETISGYIGDNRKSDNGLSFGSELNCTIYFSGGLYVSIGTEWIRNRLDFGGDLNLTNPQTEKAYLSGSNSGYIDSISLIISTGYAFSN